MDFGIECVTVCVFDWVLFKFFTFTVFMPLLMFIIIGIIDDVCNWHCLEIRDGFIQLLTAEIFKRWSLYLSSRTRNISWCKLQGTQNGHILLPKSTHHTVPLQAAKHHLHHPEIQRTCSKIHNYYCVYQMTRNWRAQWVA
jgi:hypothetical protein